MDTAIKVSLLCLLLLAGTANAQEKPAYHIPSWRTNVSYRHNFCMQHAAVERGEIELKDALRGLNLTVGFYSYQLNQETGAIDEENPDIAIDFLDELSRRAGFAFRKTYGIVDPPTENETWSDVLYFATDMYDVTGDWYTETTERLENNILYPEGWQYANWIMVMQTKDNTGFDLFAFTEPFTPIVWCFIALMITVSGILYYFLDYFDSRFKGGQMDVGLESSLFLTAFTFSGHYAHQPKSRSTRILIFSMAFFCLLTVACYTANLASVFVLENQQIVITDIQDAIKRDLTFCVEKGTAYVDYLRTFRIQPKHLVQIPTGDEEAESAAYLGLLEGKCEVVFTNKGYFEKYKRSKRHNPDCNLKFVGRIQRFLSGGFAVKDSKEHCASLVRDVLHLHMYEMKGSGTYDTIWDKYLSKSATITCSGNSGNNAKEKTYASMGVANLGGIFLLHAIALFVALSVTFFQFCQQPSPRKRAMINELKNGVFGTTTLNRAVSKQQSSPSAVGKNNQTRSQEGEMEVPASALQPMAGEETHAERGQDEAAKVGSRADLAEKIVDMMASVEQNDQQTTALVEQMLQQMQIMHERNQRMEESNKRMEKKIANLEESCKSD